MARRATRWQLMGEILHLIGIPAVPTFVLFLCCSFKNPPIQKEYNALRRTSQVSASWCQISLMSCNLRPMAAGMLCPDLSRNQHAWKLTRNHKPGLPKARFLFMRECWLPCLSAGVYLPKRRKDSRERSSALSPTKLHFAGV